jgi:hypothetical protein
MSELFSKVKQIGEDKPKPPEDKTKGTAS